MYKDDENDTKSDPGWSRVSSADGELEMQAVGLLLQACKGASVQLLKWKKRQGYAWSVMAKSLIYEEEQPEIDGKK